MQTTSIRLSSLPLDGPFPLFDKLTENFQFHPLSQVCLIRESDGLVIIAGTKTHTSPKELLLPKGLSFDIILERIDREDGDKFVILSDSSETGLSTRLAIQTKCVIDVSPALDVYFNKKSHMVASIIRLSCSKYAFEEGMVVGKANQSEIEEDHSMILSSNGVLFLKLSGWNFKDLLFKCFPLNLWEDIDLINDESRGRRK